MIQNFESNSQHRFLIFQMISKYNQDMKPMSYFSIEFGEKYVCQEKGIINLSKILYIVVIVT